jgi:HAD superfamily hydrolase (TIGR01509 family)
MPHPSLELPMHPLRALIFDVDGTLAETEEVHRAAFNQAFRDAGLPWVWPRELYARLLGVPGGFARLERFADGLDPPASAELRRRLVAIHDAKVALYAHMIDERQARLRPGVERLIEEAHSRGLAVVLATTSSVGNAEALVLANLGLEGLAKIRAIVGGDHLVARKPAPDVYLEALRVLDLPPRQCLVIEDSTNGLAAAGAAGIRAVITPSTYTRGGDFTGALAVLSHLGDQFEPYEHLGGAGDGDGLVSVAALQRWVADDDDILSLLTVEGRSVY